MLAFRFFYILCVSDRFFHIQPDIAILKGSVWRITLSIIYCISLRFQNDSFLNNILILCCLSYIQEYILRFHKLRPIYLLVVSDIFATHIQTEYFLMIRK